MAGSRGHHEGLGRHARPAAAEWFWRLTSGQRDNDLRHQKEPQQEQQPLRAAKGPCTENAPQWSQAGVTTSHEVVIDSLCRQCESRLPTTDRLEKMGAQVQESTTGDQA